MGIVLILCRVLSIFTKKYIVSRTISLTVNASVMNAYVAVPQGNGPFPAVIIFHDAFGVNGDMRGVAEKLAREGIMAVVPELFHRTAPAGFEARYYQHSIAMPHVTATRHEQIVDDLQATLKWLRSQENVQEDKVATLGFSIGGRLSFIANSIVKLAASVCVYGGQLDKELERVSKLRGAQLLVWAGRDEYIPATQSVAVVDAMRSANRDFTNMEFAQARHGYFFDGHPSYDAGASKQTWAVIKEFLKHHLSA